MGVLGAFVFAAQMVNFSIPFTGSSGHLGGGILLAILLGPQAGFVVISSVILVQALFFSDGGLLALGCNFFNMGIIPCFLVYPLIYRPLAGKNSSVWRQWAACITAGVFGLVLGAGAVVVETCTSAISELSFGPFLLFMLPIHLLIGIVEGFITALTVNLLRQARPEMLQLQAANKPNRAIQIIQATILVVAILVGGAVSWFASSAPDGLEWAIVKTSGKEELPASQNRIYDLFSAAQEKTAIMPDYGFPAGELLEEGHKEIQQGVPDMATSIAGVIGSIFTLFIIGFILIM